MAPKKTDLEAERQIAADQELRARCDLTISRAAEMMVADGASLEMIIDRIVTYATAQCLSTFGKGDALKLHQQGIRAVREGTFDHLIPDRTIN